MRKKLYEKLSNSTGSVKLNDCSSGKVYTPANIALFLAKLMKKNAENKGKNITIIDPACGDGELLRFAAEVFGSDISCEVGVDIDSEALQRASIRLGKENINKFLFLNKDSLSPDGLSYQSGWKRLLEQNYITSVDMIIANPPWGADLNLSIRASKKFELMKNQFDSSDLFIEIITCILREGGLLGIIIPDSLFFLQRELLRGFILRNYRLNAIVRLGEKLFPKINRGAVIIVATKDTITPYMDRKNVIECLTVSPQNRPKIINGDLDLFEYFCENSIQVQQNRFWRNPKFQFDIQISNSEAELVKKIRASSSYQMSDFLTSSRGVELSKTGLVVKCENCGKYFPLPRKEVAICPHCKSSLSTYKLFDSRKIIIGNKPDKNMQQIVVGENIHRYSIEYKKFIDISYDGLNYKSNKIFNGPKILVRKTGIGISASLDTTNSLCNQVVYSLQNTSRFPLELFLAILNSRLMFCYLTSLSGETNWRSHPYITQSDLNCFPIPNLNNLKQESIDEIKHLVDLRLSSKNEIPYIEAKIESFVGRLYGLTLTDYETVFSHIKAAEQLLVVRDLEDIDREEFWKEMK